MAFSRWLAASRDFIISDPEALSVWGFGERGRSLNTLVFALVFIFALDLRLFLGPGMCREGAQCVILETGVGPHEFIVQRMSIRDVRYRT